MTVWKLKSCMRCRGDIYIDKDYDGWYEHCLQCGYLRPIPGPGKVRHLFNVQEEEKNTVESARVRRKELQSIISPN